MRLTGLCYGWCWCPTLHACVCSGEALDPRQLLPALVRFGEPDTPPVKRDQVLKYVAYAMEQLRCTDRWGLAEEGG